MGTFPINSWEFLGSLIFFNPTGPVFLWMGFIYSFFALKLAVFPAPLSHRARGVKIVSVVELRCLSGTY
jgi:hypothetical protein